MFYRAIGLMSGSSLDGLDICFAEIDEAGGRWSYQIKAADCIPYPAAWQQSLQNATKLTAVEYLRLDTSYGRWIGEQVNAFVETHYLHHQVALVASHGHTTFHEPQNRMTAQLGDGATIAAVTGLNVVSNLRSIDVALNGQGAPIVPVGEKLFFPEYELLLNLGGIANISLNNPEAPIAFDICPTNRVLNELAKQLGKEYDSDGAIAATGVVDDNLLQQLNNLDYYRQSFPKSLPNSFGLEVILPLLTDSNLPIANQLRTYVSHIVAQIRQAVEQLSGDINPMAEKKMLVTGGGAFNGFLIRELQQKLLPENIELVVPDAQVIQYKEALIIALIGVLRWREEENVFASVTGASRSSVGGALWLGAQ